MDAEKGEVPAWPVWIAWDKRIIAFQKANGFEKLEYSTHEEMFRFVIEKGNEGLGIQ